MEVKKGDILQATESLIAHQTNCMGVMGSGVAKQIKSKYPEVFKGYYHFCKTNMVENLLGTTLICEANDGKYIANVFGQVKYGVDKQYTDYDALKNGLIEVHDFAKKHNLTVALPYKIGCGRGGGDWKIVSKFIDEIFTDIPITLYKK